MSGDARDLDELLDVLREPVENNDSPRLDWSSLPTFGGSEPRNTYGVWSWDATRLLVGEGRDLRIDPRTDVERGA